MKWFDRLMGRKAAELTYDQIASLIDGTGAGAKVAGVHVTEKTALQVSTVLACVKAIADGCATPRLHVYRELLNDQGKPVREKAINIPEYRLLSRRPNEWQTSFEWRREMTAHAALCGTGLSIKSKGGNNRVRELIPVMPGQWDVRRTSRYELRYRVWDEFGTIGEFAPDDVFLLHNLQWDFYKSLNYVMLARNAVGLAMATENSQSAMHANGLRSSGTYSVEGTLSPEQYERLSAVLKKRAGPENAGLPMILDRAAKWLPATMTGTDAQSVETRRLQVEEVCRAFGVFPIMVGHSDKAATFASSEAFFSAHLIHTLTPWHTAWTQRIDETLLDGSGPLYAEFDTRYMTAGSLKDRAQWARSMTEAGIYTRNEVRDDEGLDPLPGLDDPLTPLNMAGADPAAQTKSQEMRDLERKLDALSLRTAPAMNLTLKTDDIERQLGNAMQSMAAAHAEHLRSVAAEMPITINVPPAAVQVNVPSPTLNLEAVIQPAEVTVVDNHPTKSVQTVERDADGDIARTVTVYERAGK